MSSITRITKSFTLTKLCSDGLNWILFQESVELEAAVSRTTLMAQALPPALYLTVQKETSMKKV
jgi:hypothetical protein